MLNRAATFLLVGLAVACSSDPTEPDPPTDPTYSEIVLEAAPLAYWRFEETSGTTVWDSSGNDHRGTHVGNVTLGQTFSTRTGRGYVFDDNTDGMRANEVPWTNLNAVSVEAWIRPASVPTSDVILVDKGHTWNLLLDPQGRPAFQFPGNVPPETVADAAVVAGTTYHLVGTFAAGVMRLYVNGVLVDENTSAGSIINQSDPVHVGRGLSAGIHDFYGMMDEVAIYDYALSAAVVAAHYQAGLPAAVVN